MLSKFSTTAFGKITSHAEFSKTSKESLLTINKSKLQLTMLEKRLFYYLISFGKKYNCFVLLNTKEIKAKKYRAKCMIEVDLSSYFLKKKSYFSWAYNVYSLH